MKKKSLIGIFPSSFLWGQSLLKRKKLGGARGLSKVSLAKSSWIQFKERWKSQILLGAPNSCQSLLWYLTETCSLEISWIFKSISSSYLFLLLYHSFLVDFLFYIFYFPWHKKICLWHCAHILMDFNILLQIWNSRWKIVLC